jgi:fumarate reductase flavoprotein subunit
MESDEKKLITSRRAFLKGSAVIGASSILAGLTGCAPKVASSIPDANSTNTSGSGKAGPADWLGAEPTLNNIAETVESDVIVIGFGTGGAYTAASCLEKKLKVIILEKNNINSTVRNDWGAIGSKWQVDGGAKGLDKATILHYHALYCANRIDQRLPRIWADESADGVNWIGNLIVKKGGSFDWEGGYEPDFEHTSTYQKFPTGHSAFWKSADMSTAVMMKAYIEELGGEIRVNTTFVKFEHDGKKVTGAIAKDKDGKYIRFVGKKGIVLSTGGYQGNPDMLNALQPADVMVMTKPTAGPNSGDGIKACLWMGAAMDETHASMLFDRMGLLPNETPATMTQPTLFWLGSQPWLKVNLKGERFCDEAQPYDFILHAAARQPGAVYAAIMDSAWFDQIQKFQTVGCSRIYPFLNGSPNDTPFYVPPGTDVAAIEKNAKDVIWPGLIKSGHLQQADTPDELAKKLNIDATTFAATLKRYNELADKGNDDDFFKESYRLIALKTPPYYGIRLTGMILCTLDGIRIDTQMRPMDAMNEPFEGLFVIGDCSGSYFAHTYPNLFTGFANGRTLVYARRVSRIMAGEPVDLQES